MILLEHFFDLQGNNTAVRREVYTGFVMFPER